jgi:hypothetical protein
MCGTSPLLLCSRAEGDGDGAGLAGRSTARAIATRDGPGSGGAGDGFQYPPLHGDAVFQQHAIFLCERPQLSSKCSRSAG